MRVLGIGRKGVGSIGFADAAFDIGARADVDFAGCLAAPVVDLGAAGADFCSKSSFITHSDRASVPVL